MNKYLFCFIVLSLFSLSLSAQTFALYGKVIDKKTEEPLAFVNVVYGNPPRGTSTNIDGKFSLKLSFQPDKIEFSYLGYHTKTIDISKITSGQDLLVKMEEKSFVLDQVVVTPGVNPANGIIRKVYKNKTNNNPESLESFSYKSYNKMIFTVDTTEYINKDSKKADTTIIDSAEIRMKDFMNKQHLFLMESITKRQFLAPDKNNEQVLASRVSGFSDPSLVFLATQFQSFSFYDDFIQIADYNYLNPITKNSHRKYYFKLEDTLYTEKQDSVFVISYRPRGGKNFDALNGLLHINTNGYALQKVIAEPADPPDDLSIKIQQQYELIDGKQWFPSQLNSRIKFTNVLVSTKRKAFYLIGDGRTYIQNVKLNPTVNPRIFDRMELEVPDSAYSKSYDYWAHHRPMELSEKESRTYHTIDSLGKKHRFDRKLKTFQIITTGYIPFYFLDIDYRNFFTYNKHEGVRLGFGAMTNERISSCFSAGGYFAYGFKDKDWKYGGKLLLNLHEESESQLELSYSDDVVETGRYSFLRDPSFVSTENYRKYLVESMNRVEEKEAGFTFRSLEYLKTRAFLKQYEVTPHNEYMYSANGVDYSQTFHFTEAGVQLKYAYKEKFIETPWGKFSEGTDYPVLYANLRQSCNWLNGEFSNFHFEGRISQTFVTKNFGKTYLNFVGGYAEGDLPIFSLYNGNGSYGSRFSLQIDNTFATMGLSEFYVNRFFSIFLRQNFGSLLLKTKYFAPRLSVVGNFGWGWLDHKNAHKGVTLHSFEKGYYEAGLLMDNLLSVSFFSYGLGVYYRFGPYGFNKPADNFAYRLSLRFNF